MKIYSLQLYVLINYAPNFITYNRFMFEFIRFLLPFIQVGQNKLSFDHFTWTRIYLVLIISILVSLVLLIYEFYE